MQNEAELSSETKSIQVILKVQEPFMKRFDKTCAELGYTRTEAIREAMRRFQREGEKRLMERPETVVEIIGKAQSDNVKRIFEELRKIREDRPRLVMSTSQKPQTSSSEK